MAYLKLGFISGPLKEGFRTVNPHYAIYIFIYMHTNIYFCDVIDGLSSLRHVRMVTSSLAGSSGKISDNKHT